VGCTDERRRHDVRRRELNGLDYLEVGDDQRTLTVYFLGPAPEGLTVDNVRITGGRRIRDIRVLDVRTCPQVDPELDNCIVVTVDRPGDFSTYTLCLVDLPDDTPFDPRYRCLDFGFKVGCPTELDCRTPKVCPPEPRDEPEISYLAKDYASFRQLILDRLAVVMPDWRERHVPDVGITLVELLAYVGDHLSYYQDAVATEAYLETARQRASVRRHARLVDYTVHEGCNARAWVHVHASSDVAVPTDGVAFLTGFDGAPDPEGRVLTWNDLRGVPAGRYEVFEPLVDAGIDALELREAHNRIRIYTWGDAGCCLPRGATSATLVDGPERRGEDEDVEEYGRVLDLRPGDLLLFEEVIGPETGDPDDANPAHRHVVRLTRVEPVVDELYGQPLLEIAWSEADALTFPLCLSVVGPAPECAMLDDVSVARGNVVLVDHGRRRGPEDLGRVPVDREDPTCEREGRPSDIVRRPGRYRPTLAEAPLTYAEPIRAGAAATDAMLRDPRAALPRIRLRSAAADEDDPLWSEWDVRPDLVASYSNDRHLVVEVDERRRAHLRFGGDDFGRAPDAGHGFEAVYRIGNGPAGNVGADTIALAVTRDTVSGVTLSPRNPLAATGGAPPEPIDQVRRFAPHAFRRELARAVTAEDYARLAEQHPGVQRAAAELRWNGSWFEVRVAVDPLGNTEVDAELLQDVERHLHRFRRIGHDLAVLPAAYVALDVVLDVCVEPHTLRGHVRAALSQTFSARANPDGSRGFFHPDALTFGGGIALSRIIGAAQAVAGVESVSVSRLQRLFEGPNGQIEAGFLPIRPLEVARLDGDPSFPERGRIGFELRGGR
jgi:hypothetical protein